MAAYIKTLMDGEDQILPRTRTDAITTPDGTTWQDAMDAKADTVALTEHASNVAIHVGEQDRTAWDGKANKPITIQATLTADGWTGAEAPYTQAVEVLGITAETNGTVGVADSATDEQWDDATFAGIRKSGQGDGTITFKAYDEQPTVDIPISVVIWG